MGKHRLEDRELKESARRVVPTTTRTNTTVYYPTLNAAALGTSGVQPACADPAEEPIRAMTAHERALADGAAMQRAAFAQSLQSGRRQPVAAPHWPEPATRSHSQYRAPVQPPASAAPVQQAPVHQHPALQAPVSQAPVQQKPVQQAPARQTLVQQPPVRSAQPQPDSRRPGFEQPRPEAKPQRRATQHTVRSEAVARATQPAAGPAQPGRQSHTVKSGPVKAATTVRSGTASRPASGRPDAGHAAKPAADKPAAKRRSHALPSMRKKKDDLFERSFKLCTRCGEHVYVLASSCKHCDAAA